MQYHKICAVYQRLTCDVCLYTQTRVNGNRSIITRVYPHRLLIRGARSRRHASN